MGQQSWCRGAWEAPLPTSTLRCFPKHVRGAPGRAAKPKPSALPCTASCHPYEAACPGSVTPSADTMGHRFSPYRCCQHWASQPAPWGNQGGPLSKMSHGARPCHAARAGTRVALPGCWRAVRGSHRGDTHTHLVFCPRVSARSTWYCPLLGAAPQWLSSLGPSLLTLRTPADLPMRWEAVLQWEASSEPVISPLQTGMGWGRQLSGGWEVPGWHHPCHAGSPAAPTKAPGYHNNTIPYSKWL